MQDLAYKGRLEKLGIAFTYAVTTETVNQAVLRHDCDPVSAHILGRAMTVAFLSAATLGEHERLNVRWAYTGKLRTVVVDTGVDGATRGFVTPVELYDADGLEQIHGDSCEVQVVRSHGGQVTASGTVKACFQDVVVDLNYFQCISDQVESGACAVIGFDPDAGHPVRLSRGILVQALPGCDLGMFQRVRDRLRAEPLMDRLGHEGETDNLFEDVLHLLVAPESPDPGITVAETAAPCFRCTCSREKMGAVLRALPIPERMDMVKKKEDVVVSCRFCNERYTLTIDDCIKAWNTKPGA